MGSIGYLLVEYPCTMSAGHHHPGASYPTHHHAPAPPAAAKTNGTANSSSNASVPSQSSQYSPISTLERQYAQPVGRRLTIIVSANSACLVRGGVEAVLKAGTCRGASSSSSAAAATNATEHVDLLRFESSVSLSSTGSGPTTTTTSTSNGSGAFGDPFALEAGGPGASTGGAASGASTPSAGRGGGGGGGLKLSALSSKLARAARGAQDQIERGVTAVAIQAEKSKTKMAGGTGRVRPDVLAVGAFVRHAMTGEEVCVGMTEDVDIPDVASASSASTVGTGQPDGGVSFSVPLVISPSITGSAPDATITFRLFIKSGATMLAGKGKRFVVGSGAANLNNLQTIISNAGAANAAANNPGGYCAGKCSIAVVGPALSASGGDGSAAAAAATATATAALDLIVEADNKFPPLCGIGWTLSDPRVDTAYQGPLFNLPLENPLCYPLPPSMGSNGVLLTTERATESAVVLPIAVACAKLFSDGAARSTGHAADVAKALRNNSLMFDDPMSAMEVGHAQCQLEVAYVLVGTPGSEPPKHPSSGRATVSANLQRPDSIFEAGLGSSSVPVYQYDPSINYSTASALSVPFYPRICPENDPRLLPGLATARQQQQQAAGASAHRSNVFVGTVRIEIREEGLPTDAAIGLGHGQVAEDRRALAPSRILEAHVDIEPIMNAPNGGAFVQVPVYDQSTGSAAGTVVMSLDVQVGTTTGSAQNTITPSVPARGGLISLVGLDTLMEDTDSHPRLDFDADFPAAAMITQRDNAASQEEQATVARRRRITTMGDCFMHSHLHHHVTSIRSVDTNKLIERHHNYKAALDGSVTSASAAFEEPSHKRKDPRPFRPSSSRTDAPLSGIPFNVHVQAFSLVALQASPGASTITGKPMALYHNVTHGAPSDHARGFSGPVDPAAAVPGARGGLRRLETARIAASQRVRENQNELINAVAAHFGTVTRNQAPPSGVGARRHVPTSNQQIARIHKKTVDSIHALHALTWDVSVRRASVFSQALGIAITSYLSHVSDAAKMVPSMGGGGGWPEVWKRHGFLVTFEGLLSAAGKELGMIEDASVGVAMLRMVSVVFVPDGTASATQQTRAPIPHSPYLRWLNLIPSGVGSSTQYRLEIGIDQGYFNQRIPATLRDGSAVQFYPVLFQMGVDIRQWGANAAAGAKNQVAGAGGQQQLTRRGSTFDDNDAATTPTEGGDSDGGLLLDDEDDDVGVADNDVLIALNLEAFRKMNAYSHTIMPSSAGPTVAQSWEQTMLIQQQQQQIPVHSAVAKLNEYIRSSAGKMEHGVLDEAATVAAKLGGGAAIFCKSGKDRTAMQVTHKQAQFLNRYLSGSLAGKDDAVSPSKVFADATMMRIYGTRLPICEKNVGQAMYAFNSLQRKFMPDPLKPPPSTLAGFLKGGKVFSREGGIES